MTEIHDEVRASPGACLLLVARARLSAEKHGLPLTEAMPAFLGEEGKLYNALRRVDGLRLRDVMELVRDERDEFDRARARQAEEQEGRRVILAGFCDEVVTAAESILPGIYKEAA